MGSDIDGVHALFRCGAMTAVSLYPDHEFIEGRHTAARRAYHGSRRNVFRKYGPDMGAEHCVRPLDPAFLYGALRSSGALLIGLE